MESTVMSTFCEATALKLSSRRRCSAAERFGFTDRNASRSFDSIARAYEASTRRIALSSSSACGATLDGRAADATAGATGLGTSGGSGDADGGVTATAAALLAAITFGGGVIGD